MTLPAAPATVSPFSDVIVALRQARGPAC